MDIAGKNSRKRKRPAVSISVIEKEWRERVLREYRENPEMKMPIMVRAKEVIWPTKF